MAARSAEVDDRLKECEQLIDLADLAISKQSDTITMLSQQNDALRLATEAAKPAVEREDSWYRNPYFLFALGAVSGAFAAKQLSK